MIKGRKKEKHIKNDFLRLLYNRGLIYSLNVFVIGKGQTGKSSFIFYCANVLKAIQKHGRQIPMKDMTWDYWEYKKFTTTTPQRFVQLWDQYENEILALEEAGEQMNIYDWLGTMNRVFASTTSTQGMKKNLCFLITPYFDDITKHAKGRLDYVVILHHRDDVNKRVIATPRYTRLNWKSFKYDIWNIKDMDMRYDENFLKKANEFTDWLKEYKADIMDDMKKKVGLKHKMPRCRICNSKRKLKVFAKEWYCSTCYDEWVDVK